MSFLKERKFQVFIFCFAFLLFANTLNHDYAWDDSIVITENPTVKKGFKGIPELFIKSNSDYKADKYGYRPITLSSFAIEYGLFGSNSKAGHFFNVIYFSLLCVLLFRVLLKIFQSYSNLLPFAATLIFAAHPIHSEVVANIKSRDEIFNLLFSLLSLNNMLEFTAGKNIKYLLYSVIFFLLAFLSKENAIAFLAIIPLTLIYKQGFSKIKRLIIPVLVMMVLFVFCVFIVRLYTSSTVGAELSKDAGIYYENGILGNSFFYTDKLLEKFANAFLLLLLYLKNYFWPIQLVYFSGYNQIPVAKWSDVGVLISVAIHVSVLGYAFLQRQKRPELLYTLIFYFLSISVYLHIAKTLADTMADRFYFVPSLGITLFILFLSDLLLKKSIKDLKVENIYKSKSHSLLKYSFVSVLSILCLLTFSRNKAWKNNETLITNDMPALENCARAHQYYADILQDKLTKAFDPALEEKMIHHYRRSIQISDASYYSYLKLSMYFNKSKRINESIQLLDTMMVKFPKQADVYFTLGEAYYIKQNYAKAIQLLKESENLAPNVAITYHYLGLAQSKNKEFNEALKTINTCEEKFGVSANTSDIKSEIFYDSGDVNKSTETLLLMLNYGSDPAAIYKKIIGRYQLLKMDAEAKHYYDIARSKGIL